MAAWTPENAVLLPRAIPDNLLTWITNEGRQASALAWAGGSGLKRIKTVQEIKVNPKLPPYPAIEFSDDEDAQIFGNDTIAATYSFMFDVAIQGTSPETTLANARKYDAAIRSLILNCPSETLGANTGSVAGTVLVQSIQTGFLRMLYKDGSNTKDCLQKFQIKAVVSLIGISQVIAS